MGGSQHRAFVPPRRYRNGHYNTIVPTLFGRKPKVNYIRERIPTPDDDFLDLDYITNGHKRLAVLCHGLEGDSSSIYMLVFAQHLSKIGWDILALNYRGCSGVPNKQLRSYNSGTTDDLHTAIRHRHGDYDEIAIIGFSLGGNLALKYAGEGIFDLSSKIKSVVAISTPVHLSDASKKLLSWDNKVYQLRFLRSLTSKIIQKKKQFPDDIDLRYLAQCTNLYKFDDLYTAPMYGYADAEEYYAKNQSIQWLNNISIPSLIVNAKDDPFLGPKCYPHDLIRPIENVHLLTPKYGGHVGFAYNRNDRSWLLDTTVSFITKESRG